MTASPNGTFLSQPNVVLTDSGNHTFWFDTNTFSNNYTIVRDGTDLAYSGQDMLMVNGTVYLQIASGAWYTNSGSSFSATSTSSDGATATPSGSPIQLLGYLTSFGAASGSDNVVLLNGVPYAGNFAASEVFLISRSSNVLLAKTNAGQWYYLNTAATTWFTASDPTATTVDGTQVTTQNGTITDGSGNIWNLVPGTGIYENGTLASGTSAAVVLFNNSGVIFYKDSSGNYHHYVSGSFSSTSNPLATGLPAFVTPGTGSFTVGGNIYSVDGSGNAKGGSSGTTSLTGGSGTDMGALLGNQPWFRDGTSKFWYIWDGTNFDQQPVTASGTTAADSGTFMVLSNGNIATLDQVTGKVAFNGTDDSTTSNATLLLDYQGALYYENASSAWFTSPNTSGSWTSVSADPRIAPPPSGVFTVKNGQILDPNGNVFLAQGININFDTWAGGSKISESVSNAACQPLLDRFPQINMVRFAVWWDTARISTDSVAAISQAIQWLTAKKIVVMIAPMAYGSVIPSATMTSDVLPWYTSVAKAFNTNPYVFIETLNEPYADTSTGTYIGDIYSTVRGANFNNIIAICPPGGNPTTDTTDFPTSVTTSMTNVIFDIHWYAWMSSYSTNQQTVDGYFNDAAANYNATYSSADGVIPIIRGECGTCGSPSDPGVTENMTDGWNYDSNWNYCMNAMYRLGQKTYSGWLQFQWNTSDTSPIFGSPNTAQDGLISANPSYNTGALTVAGTALQNFLTSGTLP